MEVFSVSERTLHSSVMSALRYQSPVKVKLWNTHFSSLWIYFLKKKKKNQGRESHSKTNTKQASYFKYVKMTMTDLWCIQLEQTAVYSEILKSMYIFSKVG